MQNDSGNFLLIDGSNLAYRSFYGVTQNLTTPEGFPTNAIHGWLNTISRMKDQFSEHSGIVFFDIAKSKKRIELLESYKSNRTPAPDNFKIQLPIIKHISELLGYPICESTEAEADDLIASAAKFLKKENKNIFIVSSDKDLAQLVDNSISMLSPSSTGWNILNEKDVLEKFGILPSQIIDFLSLTGDSADAIPGVPGVGPKIATKWLTEFSNIDNLLENISKISPERFREILPNHIDSIKRNRKLIQLDFESLTSLPVQKSPDWNTLKTLLTNLNLHSAVKNFTKYFSKTEKPDRKSQQMSLF